MRTDTRLAIDGGIPTRDITMKPWPQWPVYDEGEEEALLRVLRSGQWWYVGGEEGEQFEREFAAFQDAAHGVACTNGTAALEIALRALDIGPGDEVIVPPYTFVATASAVLAVGATPVFVDIEPDTLNIDPSLIEPAVTERTRAIIAVHVAGRPADMDAVLEVARRRGLRVIEDAAQAHASEWRGRKVGALGDLGTFSFQATKNLNAGEGGMVLTNDPALADAAWSVMNVGRPRGGRWYEHSVLGSNFRMTEFQAAILRVQLRRLPQQTARRSANAGYLADRLRELRDVSVTRSDPRVTVSANHLFPFRVAQSLLRDRAIDAFVRALAADGIPCSTGYVPLYKEAMFRTRAARQAAQARPGAPIDYASLCLPVCEQVCKDTVWLPQTVLLGEQRDMNDIVDAVGKVAAQVS